MVHLNTVSNTPHNTLILNIQSQSVNKLQFTGATDHRLKSIDKNIGMDNIQRIQSKTYLHTLFQDAHKFLFCSKMNIGD